MAGKQSFITKIDADGLLVEWIEKGVDHQSGGYEYDVPVRIRFTFDEAVLIRQKLESDEFDAQREKQWEMQRIRDEQRLVELELEMNTIKWRLNK